MPTLPELMVLGAPNARSRTHHGGAGSAGHYRRRSVRPRPGVRDASTALPGGADRRMHSLPATNDNDVSARTRQSAAHRVTEVERPRPLDHGGVLEPDVAADELAEVADAGTEQHRHLADAELVGEAEVQRLLDDVGTGDRDELVAGDLLCRRDRLFDAAGEGRSREPLGGVFRRRTVGHDDHWGAGGVVVAPAVGLVEQPTAGDQRAAARRELPQHRGARGINREAHALLRAWHDDVAAPVPVEQLRRVVVGLGDEPVQRHAHVSQHVGHTPTTRLAPPTHRSTTDISGEPPMYADARAVRASRRASLATSVGPRSAEPAVGDKLRYGDQRSLPTAMRAPVKMCG